MMLSLGISIVFFAVQALCAGCLDAAPVESGFTYAPKASATPEEKAAAYRQARLQLITVAGTYEHTPYRYGGANRNGMDCSGLVTVSFREALGISVPRSAESLYAWAEHIPADAVQPGDLVFFKTTGNGTISHVGIFVGNRRFIHSASEGPVTGVMYSGLDERYWAAAYAGAGRAIPAADIGGGANSNASGNSGASAPAASPKSGREKTGILLGVAIAPTWNLYAPHNNIIRGAAGHIRIGAEIKPLGLSSIIGMELRPEWDRTLGVFRLPLTFSWGASDKLRIFAGPVVSFGSAELAVSGGSREYSGGTAWLGAAGITYAPVAINIAQTAIAPYAELAWQSYFSKGGGRNVFADFSANTRLSTGLRVTWRI